MIANIEQIKAAADIVEVIGEFVKLKTKGHEHIALCPFHTEKTPSFTVSKSKNIFKCFGCNKSGDTTTFLMDHQEMTYPQAIEWIASKYSIPVEKYGPAKDYVKPLPRLEKLSPAIIEHFEKVRGISNNTLLRMGITEAKEFMPKEGKEKTAICFNYHRDGELVNIKYRASGKDFKMEKNAELIFYNLDAIKDETTCVIVEGEIDCLSMQEAGIYNCVSVPNGAESRSLEYLNNCWHYFDTMQEIIVMTDDDEPGRKLRDELVRRLGKDRCKKVAMPSDCKDANDVLVKHGKNMLHSILEQATAWPIDGVIQMEDMFHDIEDMYNNGYPSGVKAMIGEFDELLSFMPGQLTTITGIPGHGKSEFTDYIMTQLARNHYWKFAIFSFENQPSSFHATKLMEKFAGLSFAHRKNPLQRMSVPQFEESLAMVDQHFFFANINQVDISLTGILNKCRELVVRKGIKAVLIDPWNYIEHQIPDGRSETQYISECLTQMKVFAVKYGVHIFLVAHPTKQQIDPKTKKRAIPDLYSIAGSAHFFNKTDNGLCVYRDFDRQMVDVYVQKVRYSWLGKVGFCSFTYDTFIRQYKAI